MPRERRIAFISDIHANLEALTAVLDDARTQEVTDFICLGDVVGYNADPCACIALIRELGCVTVCGNHDYYCSDPAVDINDFQDTAASVIEWTRRQLSDADLRWLRSLPLTATTQGITAVHSTLDNPKHWRYVFDAYDAADNFNAQKTRVCFHGHTHVPMIFSRNGDRLIRIPPTSGLLDKGMYFINVGSVGQPRDGIPEASYAIYAARGLMDCNIIFRRVPYDVETAIAKVRRANLPDKLVDRLYSGR